MDDAELLARIDALVQEEDRLHERHAGTPLSGEERARLDQLEVALDQCWDLLRQRRARRAAGRDPDQAAPRSAGTVETYEQ